MGRRRVSIAAAAVCLLISGAANYGLLSGVGALMEADPLPEREEITYLELTPLAEADEEAEPPEPPEPEEKPKLALEKKKKPKPKLEFEELPEPEPEPEKEPEPEPEPKPEEEKEKIDFVLEQLKMVEQPDELDEKEAPEDENYLSNINRDVEKETRAEVTNLEKDAIKPEAKQLEKNPEPDKGTAAEDEIAQQQEQKSQLARKAPDRPRAQQDTRPEQNDPKPKSLLSMRNLEPREHKLSQEAHEALANEAETGSLLPEQKKQDTVIAQEQRARIEKSEKEYRFKLQHKDLEAMFGKDKLAKKSLESRRQSKKKGVWEEQRNRYQSPLENMVPEVQVGNQTALRSRKHPFARYIATIHRSIHESWAWGYLEQLDTRGRTHPHNDYQLWTRVEIILKPDGALDSVKTVRYSGNLSFDAAAREIVHAVTPFPAPPQAIRSGNGKVYIHWAFHRDERACGTFGASPFILDNAGNGDRPDPTVEVRGTTRGGRQGRRLARKAPKVAPNVPEGPSLPPGYSPPKHGDPGHVHPIRPAPSGPPKARKPGAGPSTGNAGGGAQPPKVVVPNASPDEMAADPKAKKLANEWLHYFAEGNIRKAVARSTLPFYAGDTIIARTRNELSEIFTTMSEESKAAGRPKAAKVYTAAGLRKVFGSVPSGVQEGTGRVYALTKIGSEYVVLVLGRSFGTWRVVGVAR